MSGEKPILDPSGRPVSKSLSDEEKLNELLAARLPEIEAKLRETVEKAVESKVELEALKLDKSLKESTSAKIANDVDIAMHSAEDRLKQNNEISVQKDIALQVMRVKDDIASANEKQIASLADQHYKPWWKWLAGSLAFYVVTIAIGILSVPSWIKQETEKYARNNLIGTSLTNTIDNVIAERSGRLISSRMIPLESRLSAGEKRAEELNSLILELKKDIVTKQVDLANVQNIQNLVIGAKGGNFRDYTNLVAISSQEGLIGTLASSAQKEIDWYFDMYRSRQDRFRVPVDLTLKRPISCSTEEYLAYLVDKFPTQRETGVVGLLKLRKTNSVETMYEILLTETNSHVIAIITRAVSEFSGTIFEALDVDAVRSWWKVNSTNSLYRQLYAKRKAQITESLRWPTNSSEMIQEVSPMIEEDPQAWYLRCLRARCFLQLDDINRAEDDLNAVATSAPEDYQWLHYTRISLYVAKKQSALVIQSFNRLMEISPLAAKSIYVSLPKEIASDPKLNAPK